MAETEKDLIEQLKKAAQEDKPMLKADGKVDYFSGYKLDGHLRELYRGWHDPYSKGDIEEDSLLELMNLISKIDDDYLRYVIYAGMMHDVFQSDFYGPVRGYLLKSVLKSDLALSLFKHAATSKYSTLYDKWICMHFIHEPRIMDSALAMLRKEIPSVFAKGEFPDMKKLDYILSQAKKLKEIAGFGKKDDKMTAIEEIKEIEALYQKDGYIEKIDKEFNRETILNSHIHSHNLPEYMIQDVIPGTEQDINYDESEKVSKETPKEPEPAQATIVELEQENKIDELMKQIADLKKQLGESAERQEQLQNQIAKQTKTISLNKATIDTQSKAIADRDDIINKQQNIIDDYAKNAKDYDASRVKGKLVGYNSDDEKYKKAKDGADTLKKRAEQIAKEIAQLNR